MSRKWQEKDCSSIVKKKKRNCSSLSPLQKLPLEEFCSVPLFFSPLLKIGRIKHILLKIFPPPLHLLQIKHKSKFIAVK
jgi:hypothetical protein